MTRGGKTDPDSPHKSESSYFLGIERTIDDRPVVCTKIIIILLQRCYISTSFDCGHSDHKTLESLEFSEEADLWLWRMQSQLLLFVVIVGWERKGNRESPCHWGTCATDWGWRVSNILLTLNTPNSVCIRKSKLWTKHNCMHMFFVFVLLFVNMLKKENYWLSFTDMSHKRKLTAPINNSLTLMSMDI